MTPGSAIGLSAGTTTFALAERLMGIPGLTIVTNSVRAFLGEASEVDPTEVRWVRRALRLQADDMHTPWSELEDAVNRCSERERPDGQPRALFAALYPRTPAGDAEP